MRKKNIIAKVGNFEITKDAGTVYDYLRIKSISGDWGVTYRDDNEMYGKIVAMCGNEEYQDTLEQTILYIFYCTNTLIDSEFATDFFTALENMHTRMVNALPEPTEKEQQDAITEIEVLEEGKRIIGID